MGAFRNDQALLDEADGHLGWRFHQMITFDLKPAGRVPAVYLDYVSEKDLAEDLAAIRSWAPEARIVVCYPFHAPVMAEELVAAGAFHSLPKPLHIGELKQSLGFIWEAWLRSARSTSSSVTGC